MAKPHQPKPPLTPCNPQVLMEENADLRRQLGLSKQTEEELAKRNNAYQKTIKSLVSARACMLAYSPGAHPCAFPCALGWKLSLR